MLLNLLVTIFPGFKLAEASAFIASSTSLNTGGGKDLSWRSEAFAFETGMSPFEKKDSNPNIPGATAIEGQTFLQPRSNATYLKRPSSNDYRYRHNEQWLLLQPLAEADPACCSCQCRVHSFLLPRSERHPG